jgi:hypothetical protein
VNAANTSDAKADMQIRCGWWYCQRFGADGEPVPGARCEMCEMIARIKGVEL